jgi:hypothetical protein
MLNYPLQGYFRQCLSFQEALYANEEPCQLLLTACYKGSILKTFVLNIATSYHGNEDAYCYKKNIEK